MENESLIALNELTKHCLKYSARFPKMLPVMTLYISPPDEKNNSMSVIVSMTGEANDEFMQQLTPILQNIVDGFNEGEGKTQYITNRDN